MKIKTLAFLSLMTIGCATWNEPYHGPAGDDFIVFTRDRYSVSPTTHRFEGKKFLVVSNPSKDDIKVDILCDTFESYDVQVNGRTSTMAALTEEDKACTVLYSK